MKRVLILEDDPLWAEVLARYCREVGAEWCVAPSPAQAMDMIDDWRPHALCMDMLLAGETGVVLLQEIRSHEDLAALPVLVCSSAHLPPEAMAPFGVRAVLDKAVMTPHDARVAFAELVA